jgi:hypothetical protein
MTATFQFVEIEGSVYETYTDIAYADEYLKADANAEAWRALTTDTPKARAIVTAMRVLDNLRWPGSKTYEGQLTAFPRTGISGVDPDEIPIWLINANVLLANDVVNGVDIANMLTTISSEKRLKAGSVEIENFRSVGRAARGTPLPRQAWLLIQPWLAGSGGTRGARSSGTDGKSVTCDPYDHSGGL